MQNEYNGQETTQNDSEKSLATTETQVFNLEQSEEQQNSFEEAALGSMDTLNESANLLLNIMKDSVGSVKDSPIEDGIQRIEYSRAELAIQAANAISKTIQTQVNIVKAIQTVYEE